jgi:hypothetical protein
MYLNEFTGLDIDVQTGDYIGCHAKNGITCGVDLAASGGSNVWYKAGEYIDPSDSATFSVDVAAIMSLGGTGTESGVTFQPWAIVI